jgi:hypothetical protein
MTEAEWLSCTEPQAMLRHLQGNASGRKLRWFACACVRAIGSLLRDPAGQQALAVAERFADGQASVEELLAAEQVVFEFTRSADLQLTTSDSYWGALKAAGRAATLDAFSAASGAATNALFCVAPWSYDQTGTRRLLGDSRALSQAKQTQCDLLRDIFGNPFQAITLDGDWLRWNNDLVPRLARELYEDQRFRELPVLADALEEAGCTIQPLLVHLRGPGLHVRGCWALDLALALGIANGDQST